MITVLLFPLLLTLTSSPSSSPAIWVQWPHHALPIRSPPPPSFSLSPHSDLVVGGTRLYSSSEDMSVRVWDLPARQALLTLTLPSPLLALALHPLHHLLFAAAQDGSVFALTLWHVTGREEAAPHRVLPAPQPSPALSLALSLDGSRLYVGHEDGSVGIWAPLSGQRVGSLAALGGTTGRITSLHSLLLPLEGGTHHPTLPLATLAPHPHPRGETTPIPTRRRGGGEEEGEEAEVDELVGRIAEREGGEREREREVAQLREEAKAWKGWARQALAATLRGGPPPPMPGGTK